MNQLERIEVNFVAAKRGKCCEAVRSFWELMDNIIFRLTGEASNVRPRFSTVIGMKIFHITFKDPTCF